MPEKWCALLKTASIIKYQIVPIQAHQIDLISKRIAFFNQLSKHVRQEFMEQKVMIAMNFALTMLTRFAFYLYFVVFPHSMCKCLCAIG